MNIFKTLSQKTQESLLENKVSSLSEVQKTCIPAIMEGDDALIQAPTGAGKTYAYMIPLIERLSLQQSRKHFPVALILCPTRELCLQTASCARNLLSNREGFRTAVLCGGVDIQRQIKAFSSGADIVVATPSRLLDHLRRHTFKPRDCTFFVLDEADVMLKMGFREDVEKIADALPLHQTVLFSATYGEDIQGIAGILLKEPRQFKVGEDKQLRQRTNVFAAIGNDKLSLLAKTLSQCKHSALVFANTRAGCDHAATFLQKRGIRALAIHSEMDYAERKQAMARFKAGSLPVLVATDVASRGIDIRTLKLVVCLDYPDNDEDLVHRIGRTSRAGTAGTAVILLKNSQKDKIATINKLLNCTCKPLSLK